MEILQATSAARTTVENTAGQTRRATIELRSPYPNGNGHTCVAQFGLPQRRRDGRRVRTCSAKPAISARGQTVILSWAG